jgi:hypothetical protein
VGTRFSGVDGAAYGFGAPLESWVMASSLPAYIHTQGAEDDAGGRGDGGGLSPVVMTLTVGLRRCQVQNANRTNKTSPMPQPIPAVLQINRLARRLGALGCTVGASYGFTSAAYPLEVSRGRRLHEPDIGRRRAKKDAPVRSGG